MEGRGLEATERRKEKNPRSEGPKVRGLGRGQTAGEAVTPGKTRMRRKPWRTFGNGVERAGSC